MGPSRTVAARSAVLRRPRSAGLGLGAAITVVLAGFAARAGLAGPGSSLQATLVDVGIGLSFPVAAALAVGPLRARALLAGVGWAWLVGSSVPAALLAHQGILALALTTFPTGRPRGLLAWLLVGVAVVVVFVSVPKWLVAVLFAAVAIAQAAHARADPTAAAYAFMAAAAMAMVLGTSAAIEVMRPGAYDPGFWLVAYEVVLVGAAAGFPIATRAVAGARARLVDRVIGDERLVGLEGIAVVLRDVLGDPTLRVYRWDQATRTYVDGRGVAPPDGADARSLVVEEAGTPLGAIEHRSVAMSDPATAAAVTEAVRASIINLRWQEQLEEQLADLEAARARLVSVTDRQRAVTAVRLREEVIDPIQRAVGGLRASGGGEAVRDQDAADALWTAIGELDAAVGGILTLVEGVPPARLGGGGLVDALRDLAQRSPLPVSVSASASFGAAPAIETTLFYVCSEALANAIKHGQATGITISLEDVGDAVVATVTDDGIGGADPSGSGFLGLADRLATHSGRLRVESPPGAGTRVIAWVPASRP